VGQVEKTGKPVALGLTERSDLHPRVGATEYGAQGKGQYGQKQVVSSMVGAGGGKRDKVCGQRGIHASHLHVDEQSRCPYPTALPLIRHAIALPPVAAASAARCLRHRGAAHQPLYW